MKMTLLCALCALLCVLCAKSEAGAGDGIRTRDIDLGKVALYQLSYSRFRTYCLSSASALSNGANYRNVTLAAAETP